MYAQQSETVGLADPKVSPVAGHLVTCCELMQAGGKLKAAEVLLLTPTPEAMRDVEMLLDQALTLVKRLSKEETSNITLTAPVVSEVEFSEDERRQQVLDLQMKVAGFNQHCSRIAKMLEGARRVQWARMRWINSFTQTYTAAATTLSWNPAGKTLNLEA